MNTEFEYELRPIASYDGKYSVSNTGQVFSLNFNGGSKIKQLKPSRNKQGYLFVRLCRDGKPKTYYIHRLVLTAFEPNPENKPEVDHIDGNRTNNHISNLRWVTHEENHNNPITLKNKSPARKDKNIYKFRNKDTGEVFIGTQSDFYTKFSLHKGNVSGLINGRCKSVKGWILVACLTSS